MPKSPPKKPPHGTFAFQSLDHETWEGVRIFPDALARNMAERQAKTMKALQKCGLANLCYVCLKANIRFKTGTPITRMAKLVRDSAPAETAMYLCEFARTRGQAILEQYDAERSDAERLHDAGEVENLSLRRVETLRVLTKLLLMYLLDPQVVVRIQYRHLWRNARTYAEFETKEVPENATEALQGALGALVKALRVLPDGKKLQNYGSHQLPGGPRLYVLHRGYKEKVVPEYPDGCKVTTASGYLVFGLHDAPPRLEVKVANHKFIDTIRQWTEDSLGVQFRRTGLSMFEDYNATELEKQFLGRYSEEHGLAIIGIKFRRTALPNHPSITVDAAVGGCTVRDALNWYVEKGALALRSLSDIEWVRLHFGGYEGQVHVKVEPDGSVRFALDNAGWPEEVQRELADAFRKTFGIPLDQRINPRPLSMGALEVYQSLLEWDNADEIQSHQRELFEDLVQRRMMLVEKSSLRACSTAFCKLKGKAVEDEKVEACPRCHQPIRSLELRKILHNDEEMRKFAGRILTAATKWEFVNKPLQFESHEFFPLRNPARPDESVCVFFSQRISSSKIELFDRSMWPILVVHTSGAYEHAHLDLAGIAHLGFAYALAATKEKDTRAKFIEDCKTTLATLTRNEQERVLRAARQARETLTNKLAECTGSVYESVMFALVRSLFPHSMKWGGAFRPDGFCSLIYSKTNRLSDLQKWNWSYDSKYSERHGGYEFGAPEHRKMLDYIVALAEQKELQANGNELNAHVIITNSLSRNKMKDAAKFLRCSHRLGSELPGFRLVFMMEPFLHTLYDRVRADEKEFDRRWGYLSQRLAWQMGQETTDRYVYLDADRANQLADWVLQKPAVEMPVDIDALQEGLDETMSGK
jgi:hypothetical protein